MADLGFVSWVCVCVGAAFGFSSHKIFTLVGWCHRECLKMVRKEKIIIYLP